MATCAYAFSDPAAVAERVADPARLLWAITRSQEPRHHDYVGTLSRRARVGAACRWKFLLSRMPVRTRSRLRTPVLPSRPKLSALPAQQVDFSVTTDRRTLCLRAF